MNYSTQLQGLAIAYALTASAMLAGLLLMRAAGRAYFRWPVYSVMAMTLGVVVWNLLRKHLLPAAWEVTHAAALYYGAWVLYAVMGFALGLLLGRLTGRKTAGETESTTE